MDNLNPAFGLPGLPLNNLSDLSENSKCVGLKLDSHKSILFFINSCVNSSMRDIFLTVLDQNKERQQSDRKLPVYILIPLLIIYTSLMIFGACGSGLVIFVVARNRAMRTPRNVFIVNLAISDLTLCLFTQPFNLLRLLAGHQAWTLGNFMCKFTAMFQGTNIFVSTISITAIALDRFQVIVYPTRTGMKSMGTIIALVSIWIISFIMASPLVVFSNVSGEGFDRQCSENVKKDYIVHAKTAYSIASMLIQYVVPLLIVSIAYTGICLRIKYRMVNARNRGQQPVSVTITSTYSQRKQAAEAQRQRRTNILLASIAIIFALSWLPLNISNIVMDFKERSFKLKSMNDYLPYIDGPVDPLSSEDAPLSPVPPQEPPPPLTNNVPLTAHTVFLIQATCLLLVLSSACSNPVLYGWLNETFRREFQRVLVCRSQQQEAARRYEDQSHTCNNTKVYNVCTTTISPKLTDEMLLSNLENSRKDNEIILDQALVEPIVCEDCRENDIFIDTQEPIVHESETIRLSSV